MSSFKPIQFKENKLILLDQRLLPSEEVFLEFDTIEGIHGAIKDMVVRGAPCIGFTAVFGMAVWIKSHPDFTLEQITKAGNYLNSARPTAVNLGYEIQQVIGHIRDKELLGNEAFEFVVTIRLSAVLCITYPYHQPAFDN